MNGIQTILSYSSALILSTAKKKTCSALADFTLLRSDRMLAVLDKMASNAQDLMDLAKRYLNPRLRWYVIVDDTLINKRYAKLIEGTGRNYDSATGTYYTSLCSVVIMVTDGIIAIPIDHKLWIERASAGKEYKTKIEIAKELISKVASKLSIEYVLADGLYASADFIDWANQNKYKINMRFHSNRKIKIADREEKVQVKEYFEKNKKARIIKATWKDLSINVIMHKYRNKRANEKVVYLISNYNAGSVKAHLLAYRMRWAIEKFFRTAKQKLGMQDCQSRKKNVQENHIQCVFFAYAILQIKRKLKRQPNAEAVIHNLIELERATAMSRIDRSARNFGVIQC